MHFGITRRISCCIIRSSLRARDEFSQVPPDLDQCRLFSLRDADDDVDGIGDGRGRRRASFGPFDDADPEAEAQEAGGGQEESGLVDGNGETVAN